MSKILFHVGGGIGNIILSTPSIISLTKNDHVLDLLVEPDFPDTIDLFKKWKTPRIVSSNRKDFTDDYDYYILGWILKSSLTGKPVENAITLHTHYGRVFHHTLSECDMYMNTAKAVDPAITPVYQSYCGHSGRHFPDITENTVVIFPGCKKAYPMKKWDKFDELANRFSDVAIVGTEDDLYIENSYSYPKWVHKIFGSTLNYNGREKKIANHFGKRYNHQPKFRSHVKNYIGKLSLSDTAALIHQSGMFIGNDGGLSHVAAALGKKTFVIFGPTDVKSVHIPMPHNHVIQKGLHCQPCQFHEKYHYAWKKNMIGCPFDMKCLATISCDEILKFIETKKT